MSKVNEVGKDSGVMGKEEESNEPPKPEQERPPGLILDDGSINWDCPCLGGMANGPCGIQFREAFSCFHYSTADPKGSNCVEAFTKMQDCMQRYPELYGPNDDEDDESNLETEDNNESVSDRREKVETETEKVETVEKVEKK